MKPERWQRVKNVFNAALERDRAHRAEFLDNVCRDDAELRVEVESLLASHRSGDDFLERPAFETIAESFENDPTDKLLGRSVGPYTITRKIGQGGMGVVYLAEDTRLGRPVALKALAPQFTSDEQHRERLRREARVAANLTHPAIATVYALEEHGDDLYIVCEYVRGRTLLDELAGGPLSPSLLLHVGVEIARALAAAHEQGIIHRDLKPENVMRTPEGAIKILDFGLARFEATSRQELATTARLTRSGSFLGTPAYASPEQLRGLEVDFRTDIFSFGVMLYELGTGSHPFAATDSVTTIARILEAEPVALSRIRPVIPPGLDPIVRRCLRKMPDERYGTTRELVADLERLEASLDEEPAPDQQRQPGADHAEPGNRYNPRWWWQFHQAWIGFMYYAMLYPMWQVKAWMPQGWGRSIFFLTVAAVAVSANLRLHLWFTSRFYPGELAEQRRSVASWIRCADVLFVLLLLAGAVVIHENHEVITTLLVAVAIGSLGAFLLIEPTTARAAFGNDAKVESQPPP